VHRRATGDLARAAVRGHGADTTAPHLRRLAMEDAEIVKAIERLAEEEHSLYSRADDLTPIDHAWIPAKRRYEMRRRWRDIDSDGT
ncbi:MAG: hypothetical protein ABR552_05655, partial [Actinomycetota bacterium]